MFTSLSENVFWNIFSCHMVYRRVSRTYSVIVMWTIWANDVTAGMDGAGNGDLQSQNTNYAE